MNPTENSTRVVIAEDSVLLRTGLVRLLADSGFDVVAAVGDGDEMITAVERLLPDIVVADVRMPPSPPDAGTRATLAVRSAWPTVSILVLSQYVEQQYASELLADTTGGVGYLLKDRVADVDQFITAVRQVASGGAVLDPEVVAAIFARSRRRDPIDSLSPREREVLALMAEGRSNGAIAGELFVSERAVEKHVTNIFTKLGLVPAQSEHRRVRAVLRWLDA